MRRSTIVIALFLSGLVYASGPITVERLNPDNAKSLGFSVTFEISSEATQVSIVGPRVVNENCYPRRSGNYLPDGNGNELTFYMAQISNGPESPIGSGYYPGNENTMAVFIDYICPPDKILESRRYSVESVAEFIQNSVARNDAPIE
ncbi:hypothetical protein [Elongatibacter sediminis]|uniref:Uncharacterized protein n=1 Tax=Elongatibacter sediminis TaxID=3119006 RepID=A0AAW9RJY0_9GAMM